MKDLIRKLVEAWGPSGYEHHVRALVQEAVQPFVDEMWVDALGNLICRVGDGPKKIMVAAHMDEIGIMVTFREAKSGYLRFAGLGGLIQTTLHGNRVRFEDGTIGVVAAPDAFGASRTTAPDLDSFYVDVSDGSSAAPIEPGSPAAFWRTMESRGNRLIGKSMDDRVGCAVAIEALRRLQKQTPHSLYFVFTVQEEVGIRGARTAAFGVEPDLAVALDVAPTGDEIKGERNALKLGGGAAIKLQDTGVIVPPAVRDWMVARAEADGVPFQFELIKAGTTDAAGIQIARAGVPSGCISIPCRYVHTTSETIDLGDVEACVRLLTGLLRHPVPA